ncbi:MAG: response regulator transcription factor [Planctomycetes bacterium]|nr:response regulator transcription factor [Planctomycetota bacterium]
MKTILVIDDEKDLIKLVDHNLSRDGYLVLGASDGIQGLATAKKQKPDIVLLDIMLPGIDGLDVCKKLKSDADTAHIPVIMLTARAQETDKVLGLELGADDYITKPFSPRELAARVKAVLRRFEAVGKNEILKTCGLIIDYAGRAVLCNGRKIELTNTEFNLLWHLANRPGRVVTRDDLISAGRGDDAVVIDRTIDVHIASLRKKLGRNKNIVETVRGVGYKFNDGL